MCEKDLDYYIKESIKLRKIHFTTKDLKERANAQQGIELYLRYIDQLIGKKALEEVRT